MLVQDFLCVNGVDELVKKYAINARRHPKYPNLVLFKYNQIDSPMGEPIVQECRGLILDEARDWEVVSYPFRKFFNDSEGHADKLDGDFVVQEKVDGSLCVLYFYDNRWHVSTSGSPDAGGQVHVEQAQYNTSEAGSMTFAELFWDTYASLSGTLLLDPDCNYMFELTSPFNRIVVRHEKASLTLIGVRNRVTGHELPVSAFSEFGFPVVKEYPLSSMAEVVESFRTMNPLEQEGYVIRGKTRKADGSFPRVKTKHPGYVAIHHMRDHLTNKAMLEVIRTGESSEFLSYFPEVAVDFEIVKGKYLALVNELEAAYTAFRNIPVQKDFALALQAAKVPVTAALFGLRSGKVKSVKEYLATMNIKNLMDAINVKDVVPQSGFLAVEL